MVHVLIAMGFVLLVSFLLIGFGVNRWLTILIGVPLMFCFEIGGGIIFVESGDTYRGSNGENTMTDNKFENTPSLHSLGCANSARLFQKKVCLWIVTI